MTTVKWHPQWISFGLHHVNSYKKLTRYSLHSLCIPFYRRICHAHWILRGRKLKIIFTFYSFLIPVVQWGINWLRFVRSWVVACPLRAMIFEWTSFSFCLTDPKLSMDFILLTKFKASLPAPFSFKQGPCISRKLWPILLLLIMSSVESNNKQFNLLIVRAAFPSSSLSIGVGNRTWQFGLFSLIKWSKFSSLL